MNKYLPATILSIILFYLETLDINGCSKEGGFTFYCQIKTNLIEYRIWYAIGVLLLFVLYNYYTTYKEENKEINNLNDFLDQFFENNLNRNKENHRITVFHTKYGYQLFFGYVIHTFYRYKYYKNCKKIKYRHSKTPIFWKKYLVVHSRCGMPNENYKATIFKVTKDEKNINSFAENAYHTGQNEFADLPNICDIDFNNICNLQEVPSSKRRLVSSYMKKSHIKTFDSLKMFSRRTPYIAAVPLFTKKRSMNYPSHIIMYDSIALPFKEIEKEIKALSQYIQII